MSTHSPSTASLDEVSGADPLQYIAVWNSIVERGKGEGPMGFEGPEKRLELLVRGGTASDPKGGLRAAAQSEWEDVIGILNARIVNDLHNDHLDAYVLTESSLFVYSNRVLLITCGTTTLLASLPLLIDLIKRHGCEVEWFSFLRKDFTYPWKQYGPHATMEQEYALLKSHLPEGRPYIFGPVDGDHYYCYVYDDVRHDMGDMHLSLTMYQFDADVAQHFFSEEFYPAGPETARIRELTNLKSIVEGYAVQDLQFAPCGYSLNAINDKGHYQTMHITPESHCSFASYETNMPLTDDAEACIEKVVNVFRPTHFSAIVVADPLSGPAARLLDAREGLGAVEGYEYSNTFLAEYSPAHYVFGVNYVRKDLYEAEQRRLGEAEAEAAAAAEARMANDGPDAPDQDTASLGSVPERFLPVNHPASQRVATCEMENPPTVPSDNAVST